MADDICTALDTRLRPTGGWPDGALRHCGLPIADDHRHCNTCFGVLSAARVDEQGRAWLEKHICCGGYEDPDETIRLIFEGVAING
jgi:hypothetical protein